MRKLRLDLEAVVVESFVTAGPLPGEGTVRGHWGTEVCGPKTDAEQTYCCPTYAPHVCMSIDDGCPTVKHGVSVCYCNTNDCTFEFDC